MTDLKVYLFGFPRLEEGDQPVPVGRRKGLALLAYLAVTGQAYSRDTLATVLWPDSSQQRARGSLRQTLSDLNKVLGSERLLIEGEQIALAKDDGLWLDVAEFQKRLAQVQRHDHRSAEKICPDCWTSLQEAAALYSADFLAGFTLRDAPMFDEWQFIEAEGLRRDYASVLEKLTQLHTNRQTYDLAIEYGRTWLGLDTMHESAHRALMKLYALTEQQAVAIRQYEECVRILDEELGADPDDETTQLYEAIRTRRFPGLDGASANARKETSRNGSLPTDQVQTPVTEQRPKHNLPLQPTSFIGRQDELAAIQQMLTEQADCRLVTLIGPGGIGKTRLAVETAHKVLDTFSEGVCFVGLASVGTAEDIVSAIVEALAFTPTGDGELEAQLINDISSKNLLLVVDNLEHVLDGAALFSKLLLAAADIKILATSRESLALHEEWLYPVGGLTIPDIDSSLPAIQGNGAVQLFLQRARHVNRGFELSSDNVEAVVRICQLVGGMPLGIELAAAWVRLMSCDEIRAEIEQGIDILATSLRNIPERHRSLRVVFQQTWQRLTPSEQRVLQQISVFRGAFTREAAQQVTNASLADISSMVDKSLCRHRGGRYDMHELLRQFAFEQMDEAEQLSVQAQHSRYFGDLLATQKRHIMTDSEDEMLKTISDNFDNILAAWRYLLDRIQIDSERERCAELIGGYVPLLAVYFDRRSLFWEGRRIFQQAIAVLQALAAKNETIHELNLQLQIENAGIGMHLGRYQEEKDNLLGLLPHLRAGGNKRSLAGALTHLGPAYMRMGEFQEAIQCLQEAIDLYEALDLKLESTIPMINLGLVYNRSEQYEEARGYLHQAAAIYEQIGYGIGLARCLSNIGSSYARGVNIPEAFDYYRRAYQIATDHNNRFWIGVVLSGLGYCAYEMENLQASREQYTQSLAIFRELREMRWITVILADSCFTLLALNDLEATANNLLESLKLARQYQLVTDGLQALNMTAQLLEKKQQYEPAVKIATFVVEDSRSSDLVLQESSAVLAATEKETDDSTYAAAQFQGRIMTFDLMVDEAIKILESDDSA